MNDRIDPGGGGLTGATGNLTPDESEGAFVPGERREVEDEITRANVTSRQGESAPAQRGEVGDPHRMEIHPPAHDGLAKTDRSASQPRIGGDELSEGEERF